MCRHRHLQSDRLSSRNTIITHTKKKKPKSDTELVNRFNTFIGKSKKEEENGSFD